MTGAHSPIGNGGSTLGGSISSRGNVLCSGEQRDRGSKADVNVTYC